MMAGSVVEGERSKVVGGGSGEQKRRPRERVQSTTAQAYRRAFMYAHIRAYVSLAVKASGLLAFLLSTVTLLGGYVQSLPKQDFFCIMAITVIQAAGIFQDWETNIQYLFDFRQTFLGAVNFLIDRIYALALVLWPFAVLVGCVSMFYLFGPLACAAISAWRIAKLNHGNSNMDDGTASTADMNMMATLNIFYSLIIFQGTIFGVLLCTLAIGESAVASRLLELEKLTSDHWGKEAIEKYLSDISAKCRKDPLSIEGMDLIKYAGGLLDSESLEDYLCGARILSAFVNNKAEGVRWVLLPSRQRIQRLIGSLMISSSCSFCFLQIRCRCPKNDCFVAMKEIRELAATIVTDVAAHIDDLSMYPGAMRCISSLLQDQEETKLMLITERGYQHRNKREGGTSNELVQQGLTILERLASNSDINRRIICSTADLLPKITAPVYSTTLIQDVKTKAWADIVTRCLRVLYHLIRFPGHQIFSNNDQALSNLKSILLDQQGNNNEPHHQELQLVAMDILTELSLDLSSNNLTVEIKKVLITKQRELFLPANGDDEKESAAIAGRAMVSLSTNSGGNSALIMTTENDIIDRLTEILDGENITRRTIAAEIMANLCPHCNVENTMKELLRKVIREIMLIKIKSQQREASADQRNPALADEENQGNSVSTRNTEQMHDISIESDDTEIEEISDQEREEQEAFLSLAQVICNKLDSADLDKAIQSAVDQNNAQQRREAFVDKLKAIVDGNCHPAADSLRIVKFCGQIAKSVMRCEQYVAIFRNRGFNNALSEASKTMYKLESCMLFVGTDFGLKKTVRPLFSEIEEDLARDVATR